MHRKVKFPKFVISEPVFEEIRRTIGSLPAETGGVLGGNLETGAITDFFFDEHAICSEVIYTIDPGRINTVLQEWNEAAIHLTGIVHSHKPGCREPSPP